MKGKMIIIIILSVFIISVFQDLGYTSEQVENLLQDLQEIVPEKRIEALQELKERELGEEEISEIIKLLDDPSWDVGQEVISVLEKHGEIALPLLEEEFAEYEAQEKFTASQRIISIIDDRKTQETLAILSRGLKSENDEVVEQATKVIKKFGSEGEKTVPDLIQNISHENNRLVFLTHQTLNSVSNADDVLSYLKEEYESGQNQKKIEVLANLNELSKPVSILEPEATLEIINQALQSEEQELKLQAISVLSEIGSRASLEVPELTKIFYEEEDFKLRKSAWSALININPRFTQEVEARAIPFLLQLLDNSKMNNFVPGLKYSWSQGSQSRELTEENILEEITLYQEAIKTLQRFDHKSEEIVPELVKFLQSPVRELVVESASALGGLGEEALPAVPELKLILGNEKKEIRQAASRALADIKGEDDNYQLQKSDIEFYTEYFRSSEPEIKALENSQSALLRIGDKSIPELKEIIQDENLDIMARALAGDTLKDLINQQNETELTAIIEQYKEVINEGEEKRKQILQQKMKDNVFLVDIKDNNLKENFRSVVIQGLANRKLTQPVVFTLLMDPTDEYWVRTMHKKQANSAWHFITQKDLIDWAIHNKIVTGQILYDPEEQFALNTVMMFSAVNNTLPVTESQKRSSLEVTFDTRSQWDNEVQALNWAKNNLLDKMNHNILGLLTPELLTCKDFLVSKKVFTMSMTSGSIYSEGELRDLWLELLEGEHFVPQTQVMGYPHGPGMEGPGGGEVVNMLTESKTQLGTWSDYASNLSYYSQFSPIKKIEQPPTEEVKYDPEKAYVALIVSDGDNIQMNLNSFRQSFEKRSRIDSKVPLSWTISNWLLEYAPPVLEYYYNQAQESGQDSFLMGPSGYAFVHPSHYADMDWFAKKTSTAAKKLDMEGYVHWDEYNNKQGMVEAIKAYSGSEIKGIFTPITPRVSSWINDIRIFQERYRLNIHQEEPDEKLSEMINNLNSLSPGELTYVYVIHHSPLDKLEIVPEQLEDHIELVGYRELIELAEQKRKMERQ
ncbi:MAG: hypothetical protein ACOCQ1_03015 [Halanaerobiaceae bacterium]